MSYSTGGAIQEYRAGVPSLGTAASLPSDISGLQLWYKADQVTGLVDADPVTTWTDLGALLKDLTQSTATNKPIYKTNIVNSLPVVRFDGSNDRMSTATFTAIAQPVTVFCVAKSSALTGAQYFDTTNRPLFGTNATPRHTLYAGSSILTSAAAADTDWHVYSCIFNGASSIARRDGTSIITGNPGTQSFGNVLYVGGDPISLTSAPLNGDIAELGVYNSALGTTDHNNLGSGLATKYALTWNTI